MVEQLVRTAALPALAPGAAAHSQLPAGTGQEETFRICKVRHDLGRITQNRLSRSDWEATVTKMVLNGAVGTDEEASTVVEFLSKNFSP